MSGRPLVFIAFSHNPVVDAIAVRIRDGLRGRGVDSYRARDDRHPGWHLQQRIDAWIARSDGVVMLWSKRGSVSPGVIAEYETAKRLGRRLCLVLFPNTSPPSDWSGIEWLDLSGVRLPLQLPALGLQGPLGPGFFEPQWSRMVDEIARFARRVWAERRGIPPSSIR